MPIVLDTSLALAWCLPDERSSDAMRVLRQVRAEGDTFLAPPLWLPETANAVVSALRRGRITDGQAKQCVELLAELPVEFDAHTASQRDLVATALQHDLSAYDATYLVLATRAGCPLATLDARLATAARSAGITVVPE